MDIPWTDNSTKIALTFSLILGWMIEGEPKWDERSDDEDDERDIL